MLILQLVSRKYWRHSQRFVHWKIMSTKNNVLAEPETSERKVSSTCWFVPRLSRQISAKTNPSWRRGSEGGNMERNFAVTIKCDGNTVTTEITQGDTWDCVKITELYDPYENNPYWRSRVANELYEWVLMDMNDTEAWNQKHSWRHNSKLYDGYYCNYQIGLITDPHTSCCMWYKEVSIDDDGKNRRF